MTKEFYESSIAAINSTKIGKAAFGIVYKGLPVLLFVSYPLLLIYLFYTHNEDLFKCVAVPFLTFVTLSAARHFINAPRPYEVYDFTPLYPKDTKGKSFPSRHTASAAVIAMTFFSVSIWLGIPFVIAALLIAASRVFGGVHFPKDVIAGILYAMICGVIFFI